MPTTLHYYILLLLHPLGMINFKYTSQYIDVYLPSKISDTLYVRRGGSGSRRMKTQGEVRVISNAQVMLSRQTGSINVKT